MGNIYRRGLVRFLVLASMTTAALATVAHPAPAASSASAYSGDAYGIGLFGVKVVSGLVSVSDTKLNEVGPFNGSSPMSGDSGLVAINFAASGLRATANTARSTVAEGNSASSASSALQTANVSLGLTSLVRASVLSANTAVDCSGIQTLKSQVLSLSVAGLSVNVNVSPNTTITVRQPLTGRTIATVVIGQQNSSTTATHNAATANALVVSFPANGALAALLQGTVVISHAESDVTCGPTAPPSVAVSVGYVDNFDGGTTFFPTPWQGDPGVTFVGTDCARGTTGTCDDGAIRIDNTSGTTITGVRTTVDVGPNHYDLWGSQSIPAGGTLIMTQTAPFNFDTSETNPPPCGRTATIPVVHVTINGITTDYGDTAQVLNTGGVDKSECPSGTNEGQQWQLIS